MRGTLRFAFKKSIPVLFGYIFLGLAFGLLLQQAGYNWVWALFISLFVYSGSMQFVLVSLLSAGSSLITAAIMTLVINFRYIFYGISFIGKFNDMGRRYPYMVFSLTDETYSLLCSLKYPKGIDEKQASFYISLFHHIYWVLGCVIGALVGQMVSLDFTGIDFSMTALFVVIFIEQWESYKCHIPAVIGLISSILFLILVGPGHFIIPSLIVSVLLLMLFKPAISKKAEVESI